MEEGTMKQQNLPEKNVEEEYAAACGKRTIFLVGTIFLLLMPVLGYLTERLLGDGFRFPSEEELLYFPLNAGVYAVQGVVAAGIMVLLIRIVMNIIQSGFYLSALIGNVLVYVIVVAVFVDVVGWMTGIFNTDFHIIILGIEIDGSSPIPGPGETLGLALSFTVIYDFLLVLFLVGAAVNRKRCKQLKEPAMEAQIQRKMQEQQEKETKEREKRLKKERKEREKRERVEYERYVLAQARAVKVNTSLGEYSFFEGCMTLEQADARFQKMLEIYDAPDGSGDPALARVLRQQYETVKERFTEQ